MNVPCCVTIQSLNSISSVRVISQHRHHVALWNPPVSNGNLRLGFDQGLTGSVLVGLAGDLLHTLSGEPSHVPTRAAFPESPFSNAQH